MPVDAQQLLEFWFSDEASANWFRADATFDDRLRRHFGGLARDAAEGRLDHWSQSPSSWLALLILLDQCPRNLHRHEPGAWAQDVKAQRVALSGISRGDDRQLPPLQRVFAYLPLEHAEDMGLQQRSVALFEALSADVPEDQQQRFSGFLDYARRHREVVARFGRFPHRNTVLGRTSTPEEVRYLAEPGAGF
ncbi:MAG: DUF924 domain-containing protein [Rhodanobacter sp.]|nr:MAG: DUF924 domain-containing protein [Rhodanobacter sp.]